jgi:hypothetical protein
VPVFGLKARGGGSVSEEMRVQVDVDHYSQAYS